MVALSLLVSGLDAELVRLGYKGSTMVWYRGCWRRLEKFFAARGVEEFSRDLALAWVDEGCGFSTRSRLGRSNRPMSTCSRHHADPHDQSPGLCAALDRRPGPHQARHTSATHNPALRIGRGGQPVAAQCCFAWDGAGRRGP